MIAAVNVVYLHVRGWTLQYLAMLHSYVGWPGISLTNYGWLENLKATNYLQKVDIHLTHRH